MIEDKLSRDERIRLEAVAQANMRMGPAARGVSTNYVVSELLAAAQRIAAYVEGHLE